MKSNNSIRLIGLFAIIVCAFTFRMSQLDVMPMHHDEANQAIKFGELLEKGDYQFDSKHHHGPSLYYLSVPIAYFAGEETLVDLSESTLRFLPALLGSLLVVIIMMMKRGVSRKGVFWAGLLTAISPGMVYMSRYFVHEMVLVFFIACAIATGWRYYLNRSKVWALLCGVSVGFMHATKETCIIALFAMLVSLLFATLMKHKTYAVVSVLTYFKNNYRHVAMFAFSAIILSVLFYSSFGKNLYSPLDSIATFFEYEVIEGHEKDWSYYLRMLVFGSVGSSELWIEGAVLLLAVIGAISILARKDNDDIRVFGSFITFYTLITFIVYSSIAYKTPWLILTSMYGMLILAGVGSKVVIKLFRGVKVLKYVMMTLVALMVCFLGKQAWALSYRYYSDVRNPYAYSSTVSDLLNLTTRVKEISQLHPDGDDMRVNVISTEYWPIPWYLRSMKNVGYWHTIPVDPDAPVIITTPDRQKIIDESLKDKYFIEYRGLRPGVVLILYVREDLWEPYIEAKAKQK